MITPSLDFSPEDVAVTAEALRLLAGFSARYGSAEKIARCKRLEGELLAASAFARGNRQSPIADSPSGGPRA